jgi:hypothetical protein
VNEVLVEILLHLIGHKEAVSEEEREKHLLQITLSKHTCSWSEYLIQNIGMFSMCCTQQKGFKDIESVDYRSKFDNYKSMAFKTNLSALAIYNNINKSFDIEFQNQWLKLSLLNSRLVFNRTKHKWH